MTLQILMLLVHLMTLVVFLHQVLMNLVGAAGGDTLDLGGVFSVDFKRHFLTEAFSPQIYLIPEDLLMTLQTLMGLQLLMLMLKCK